MGQAWCKEKTSKAQDSKSPLDRVFLRCAHRIYPSLKEEGSVLGGATQRVTSSEIGYAGSPPREAGLARGRSIDSVDRPFHPSEWVDVNLEVPSTPRPSSILTNLTLDTSLYPGVGPTSSRTKLKDVAPVPPPRRRKRNKGRPLPPKPDEILENSANNNLKRSDRAEEPLYSSVKSPKTSGDEQEAENEIGKGVSRRTKEIYEHKVNGTGRIIPSDVVSGRRTSSFEKRKIPKTSETSSHQETRIEETREHERFARKQQPVKDSSTPNRQDVKKPKESEKRIKGSSIREHDRPGSNVRPKNYSTVSLPNYDELDVTRHPRKKANDDGVVGEKTRARRPVRSSTGSLPAESFLSPFSEKTSVRFEDYVPRRGSNENLEPYRVLEKLNCSENGGFVKYNPNKLEDWDLYDDITNCESNYEPRLSLEEIEDRRKDSCEGEDVVDFSSSHREKRFPADREVSGTDATGGSPISWGKPEAFGKTPSTLPRQDSSVNRDRSRSSCSEEAPPPPTLVESHGTSIERDSTSRPSSASREPFYLDEVKHRAALDTIGGSDRAIGEETDRFEQSSRMIFGRSLSNESEPSEDALEAKELRRCVARNLVDGPISEESLPTELVREQPDDLFDEKLAKDVDNSRTKRDDEKTKTPPPSPEPRIKPEILDNDHSGLLKVLKEETIEESNLSSMTPSLTELEAALSDMLEKEETPEELLKSHDGADQSAESREPIEPEIIPIEKNYSVSSLDDDETSRASQAEIGDETLVEQDLKIGGIGPSSGRILEEKRPSLNAKGRKVSFCAWEESTMAEIDLDSDREFIRGAMDEPDLHPPEKPSRLHRNTMEDLVVVAREDTVPTPPRRKNKASLSPGGRETETPPNDRLV